MIHICTDHWTPGVSELTHEVAQEFGLHPPEPFHPLIQIRDSARAWMGLGVELFSWDLSETDRHSYLVRACHALIVLHAGDLSDPLLVQNGGMIVPHYKTGPFGTPAAYAWNTLTELRKPRASFNILTDSVSEAQEFIGKLLDSKNVMQRNPLRIAVTGPKERYKPGRLREWLCALFEFFKGESDPRHLFSYKLETPLLKRILEDDEEARKAFSLPLTKPQETKGAGKAPGKPKKGIPGKARPPAIAPPTSPPSPPSSSPVARQKGIGKPPVGKPKGVQPSAPVGKKRLKGL